MRKVLTNKSVAFLLLVLIISFALVGCEYETDIVSSSHDTVSAMDVSSNVSYTQQPDVTTSEDAASEDIISSLPTVSSTPPNAYGDLLLQMTDSGETVTAYGDLKNAEYSSALAELQGVLNAYTRTVSLVAYRLDDSKALCYNTKAELFCACTVKAPYALYCCRQMESGNGSLATQLTYEQKHYESGTGDMQYSPFGTVFSMETAITKSMSISDNVGYIMTVDFFGREGYNDWISSLGCPSLMIKPTVWSLRAKARELAIAWREIYKYFSDGTEYATFLYNTCTNTADNYATAALSGVDYSHKQGHNRSGKWLAYSDAGIVWRESPYIIVILTDAPGPSNYDSKLMADVINIIDGKLF